MNNHALQYTPTLRERIGHRLFPARWCDIPEVPGMRDVIVITTVADLSFLDRLRVFVSGRIEVGAKIATEKEVGRVATNTVFMVRPPAWLDR